VFRTAAPVGPTFSPEGGGWSEGRKSSLPESNRPGRIDLVRDREHSNPQDHPSRVRSSVIAGGLLLLAGCAAGSRPPAAASNEDFSDGTTRAGLPSEVDDRWASVTLDASQRSEVRTILAEAAQDPYSVRTLVPARYGVRFEDVPHAMLNAAPKVEMAVLRQEHLPPEVDLNIRDSAGRSAMVLVDCRERGAIATVSYRIPGGDIGLARAELLAAVREVLDAAPDVADPTPLIDPLVNALVRTGATIDGWEVRPERYRYTLLMLDEQEATIEIRREPAPKVVSWTATAGTFPRPEIASRLGEAFMDRLRAWGRVPRADGGSNATPGATASAGE
jgi:hypothetical protein